MVMRILIVDDCNETVETLKRALRLKGHEIIGVLSAEEALVILTTDKDSFDVVLTDYCMPEMNGVQLLQRIRKTDACLPVVMMTAYNNEALSSEALKNRCNAVIEKPLNIEDCNTLMSNLVSANHRDSKKRGGGTWS